MKDKWTLQHGCHRGTLMSRDIAQPQDFATREAAIAKYQEHRAFYRSIGYQIWYAYLLSPDGEMTILEQNTYSR